MRHIDLNADLGEGGLQDAALIAVASSANIACGGHAGDETTMRRAIEAALTFRVAIGAHPGYEDPQHFGRRPLDLGAAAVADLVSRQIERLAVLAARAGAKIHHVKPHGALYTQASGSPELAAGVAAGVRRILPGCGFYAPPGGPLAAAGSAAGLSVHGEGFIDRRYLEDGTLVPRDVAGAVIEDLESAVAQAMEIACKQQVSTVANTRFHLHAATLCVHGDGIQALALLQTLRQQLESVGFTIRSP